MSLVLKSAPATGRAVVRRALRDLWDQGPTADAAGGAAINLAEPIPLYRLGLNQIDATGGLTQAQHVGWRYLLETAGGDTAVADVGEVGGGETRFASLARGENARRLIEAATLAESVAQQKPEEYEVRILDVPALHVSAIWLAGENNIFIPYLDMKRLRGAKVDVADDFLNTLASRAQTLTKALSQMDQRPDFRSGP
ncbi:hypothetical protein [Methylobacterium nodulans]|uniref:Uncharacterized protein n=1 Tax=Methylobacterium nodulans (strain LMG 21967 / CNCM I-2342 / ORS 2060) TaxID=460265 RepID=B8IF00_METNO|nr:hypothetical protein [Methylobacterium nodulans]ACL55711.1 conserved hypothetical protein [Methylobacterium nodulans ORS 2060]